MMLLVLSRPKRSSMLQARRVTLPLLVSHLLGWETSQEQRNTQILAEGIHQLAEAMPLDLGRRRRSPAQAAMRRCACCRRSRERLESLLKALISLPKLCCLISAMLRSMDSSARNAPQHSDTTRPVKRFSSSWSRLARSSFWTVCSARDDEPLQPFFGVSSEADADFLAVAFAALA